MKKDQKELFVTGASTCRVASLKWIIYTEDYPQMGTSSANLHHPSEDVHF